jgi:hypothetical protein
MVLGLRNDPAEADARETALAETLLAVWHSAASTGSAGIGEPATITARTATAADLLLAGGRED